MMPRPSTCPIVINDLLSISIALLKKKGLLNMAGTREAEITWSNSFTKEVSNSIGLEICTQGASPYIRLTYSVGKEDISDLIPLIRVLSNLGKGYLWLFICPKTNKRCSKLFLHNSRFVSRKAVIDAGGLYHCNLRQMRYRSIDTNRVGKLLKIIKQRTGKHFMTEYRGKVTKRQERVNRAWRKLKDMGFKDISAVMNYMGGYAL